MRFRKGIYIIFLFVGLTLFAFSLMPFFREFYKDTFWIMTVASVALMAFCMFAICYKPKEKLRVYSKYKRKIAMLTQAELKFLSVLRDIEPEKYDVVPKIALNDVLEKLTNTAIRNELNMVCDFCFVDKGTYEPLLLVKLNDRSHLRSESQDRDAKFEAVCLAAGMPLLTFWLDGNLEPEFVGHAVMKAVRNPSAK